MTKKRGRGAYIGNVTSPWPWIRCEVEVVGWQEFIWR
jgi:hypothetical protein